MTADPGRPDTPWMVYGPPPDGDFVVFGFHYAGVGASSTYRDWPAHIGTGGFCPLQPPGREDRMLEEPLTSHRAFAAELAPTLAPYLDRPYGFVGHCGAFPYMLETTFALQALGLPLPRRLFASSWGAPHRGPYGRLNFLDLDQLDVMAEIQAVSQARLGRPLPADMAELAAETLLFDLRVQRAYRYGGDPPVPVPTVVLGWTEDDVVPPEQVWPGWTDCADVTCHLLAGDHLTFLSCPPLLQEIIVNGMAADGQDRPCG